ncbi:MAG: hypothetical protein ABIT37_02810 [Luteolibacter sp.]
MIIAFVSRGAGILVIPVVALPIFTCIGFVCTFFPEPRPSPPIWVFGACLLLSAVVLFVLNRHVKQGAQPAPRPSVSGNYAKYARKQTIDAETSKVRSTRRFSADNDTGWFMFIPTGAWPFIIGALGTFLIAGNIVESIVTHDAPKITRPPK